MDETQTIRVSRAPEVVRGRILDAAQAEFMAAGFSGASTNRILERFGGSKPTMFRHYPTKRDLFAGVVGRIAARWDEAMDWRHIESSEPEFWLRAFAAVALRWILTEDNLFVGRMAIAEGSAFPDVAEIYRKTAVEPIEAVLAQHLRAWTEQGILNSSEPARDATRFLDLALSGVVSRRLYGAPQGWSGDDMEAHVNGAVELFLHGRLMR